MAKGELAEGLSKFVSGLRADTTYTVTMTAHSPEPLTEEQQADELRMTIDRLERQIATHRERLDEDTTSLKHYERELKELTGEDGIEVTPEVEPVHRAEWVEDEGWVCRDCGGASMDRGLLEGVPCLRD